MQHQAWIEDIRQSPKIFCRPTLVTMQTPSQVALVRAEYKSKALGKAFRVEAIRQLIPHKPTDRQVHAFVKAAIEITKAKVHHVKPIGLGGGNEPDNLSIIHESWHLVFHAIIDRQIAGLRPGDSKVIQLPIPTAAHIT